MYNINIASATKTMLANEIRDFIFENYYKEIGFSKETVKRITQKPKSFKNPNIVWIKIGYYRTSKKLHINYPRLYSRLESRSQ